MQYWRHANDGGNDATFAAAHRKMEIADKPDLNQQQIGPPR
jgi:hypothetical protein